MQTDDIDETRSGGQPVGGGLVAMADELRANLFAALRRHDVSEQCFAEAAMITQHFKTLLTAEALGGVVDVLKHALVTAAIPLEALVMSGGAKAHCQDVQDAISDAVATIRAALKEPAMQTDDTDETRSGGQPVGGGLGAYDAGLLNDFGGGNVEWWWDYIRAELERAHEHYAAQTAGTLAAALKEQT